MLNIARFLMRTSVAVVALAFVVSGASRTSAISAAADQPNQLTAEEKSAGWTLLFDGKSLDGWRGYKQTDAAVGRWRVEDGMLTVDQGNGRTPTARSTSSRPPPTTASSWRGSGGSRKAATAA